MDEYKEKLEASQSKINKLYIPTFQESLSYICGIVGSITAGGTLNHNDISLLKNSLNQFNGCYNQHPGTLSKEICEEFSVPKIFFDIYFHFPLHEDRDLFLSALTSLNLLSSEGLLSFSEMHDAEIAQDFIQKLLNYQKNEAEGNDTITMFSYICSIIDNVIIENEGETANDFISIGISNALNEFVSNISQFSPNEASVSYLEGLSLAIMRLRHHLALYGADIEESIDFVNRIIDSGNEFLIEKIYTLVSSMISKSMNICPLFQNQTFMHQLCQSAFNNNNIKAINVLCEYLLYDEKAPELHDSIIDFTQNVDFPSLFETIKDILTQDDRKNEKIAASLISLIGNIIYICHALPDSFNPDQMIEIYNIIVEKGFLDEKISISFLLLEVWTHIPIPIVITIAEEKEFNFVFENASLAYEDLANAALEFLKHFFEEKTNKSLDVPIYPCIIEFLKELTDGPQQFSEKAEYLINTYHLDIDS